MTTSRRRRLLGSVIVALAGLLVLATPGWAHSGGRAVPVATVSVSESGPLQALVDVRLRDEDGGEVIRGATVKGFGVMTSPHTMTTYFDRLPEVAPGRYRGRVKLPMTARWTVELSITGDEVVPRTVRAAVLIDRSALTEADTARRSAREKTPPLAAPVVAGTVRFAISDRELTDMVVLWIHGLAATAWILGLGLLLTATTAGAGWFAASARDRLSRWFRRRGLPLLVIAAAAVVATGIYNTLRVSPFELAWTPAAFGRLTEVPYGKLYETILLVKLALFAVMLYAGLVLVARTPRRWTATGDARSVGAHVVGRLGVSGVLFLLCAPAIVGAVVALRYVHILSHVAEAGGAG